MSGRRPASQVFETLDDEDRRHWLNRLSIGQFALLLAAAFGLLCWLLYAIA